MHNVIHFIVQNHYFELFLNQNNYVTTIKPEIFLMNNFFDVAIQTKIMERRLCTLICAMFFCIFN